MSASQVLIAGHTIISIVAILAGALALRDIFRGRASSPSISAFLILAVATSATGFVLPLSGVSPAVVIAIVALAVLIAVLLSKRRLGRSRSPRWIYVGGLVASEYLLIFVGVAQAFAKISILQSAAPTQSEPPFAIAQGIVLVAFLVLGILAIRSLKPESDGSSQLSLASKQG
jgi:hypothetical protein